VRKRTFWHRKKYVGVQEQPDQEGKIDPAGAHALADSPDVRAQHHRGKQRDDAEENDDVREKGRGRGDMQHQIQVSPSELDAQPHAAAEREKSPKSVGAAIARDGVPKQASVSEEWNETEKQVSADALCRARREQEANRRAAANKEQP
jgi:hypothetical protein